MIKKASISIIAILILVTASTITVSAETITHTDSTGDVVNSDDEIVEMKDIDIEKITAIKDGKQVELKLKLVEGGTIQEADLLSGSGSAFGFELVTSHDKYAVLYVAFDFDSIPPQLLENLTEAEIAEFSCRIMNDEGDLVDVISHDGFGKNEISIKFNLLNNKEEMIAISALSEMASNSGEGFYDEVMGEELSVDVQELYNATTGNPASFQGSLEEGDASDYNWVWFFEETNTVLTTANPSHTFKIPDVYDGTVYAFDDDGNYGEGFFSVNVTGKAINGGDDNGSPGFEILILFAAIAVAMILLRKRK